MYNDSYYDRYDEDSNKRNKLDFRNLNLKGKLIIGSIGIIIIIIILIVINYIKNYYNSYEYMEKELILAAQKYINDNNFLVNDEIYLDITKLGFEINNKCNITSGVFVDSNYNYKAHLSCKNYTSNVIDNDESKVSLNGEEIIILGKNVNYIEKGVSDNNKLVKIEGEVKNNEGVYNLKYFVIINNSPIILTRKVVVIDNIYVNSLYPSLTLKGNSIKYVQNGSEYQDEGVFANDVIDSDLTHKVKVTGNVNVNEDGEYEITYTVTNSRGYSNSITRKVIVINDLNTTINSYLSTDKKTSDNVIIYIEIIGKNYDYMILPDGNKTNSKTIEYTATENDTYNFISYDKDGKTVTKTVIIDNIDRTKPNAVCVANVYDNYTKITVTPYSGNEISHYNYMIDGVFSGNSVSTSYQVDKRVSKASVVITDIINNTNTIDCDIKVIDEVPGNDKVKYYKYNNQRYIIAKTKNNLDDFLRVVAEKEIYQSAKPDYWNKCLSFAYYHARNLYLSDNLNRMNNEEASVTYDSSNFTGTTSTSKRPILEKVYEQINKGRPCIILMASSGGNTTHYMTVVGYRDSADKNNITEYDLLLIDPNRGVLESPARSGREMYRTPYTGIEGTYYALYYLKDNI